MDFLAELRQNTKESPIGKDKRAVEVRWDASL